MHEIEKKCHEWQKNPGYRIVNGQIPISRDELKTVAQIKPAVEPVIDRQRNSEIECQPKRHLKPSLGSKGPQNEIDDSGYGNQQKRVKPNHQKVGVLLIVRRQASYPKAGPNNGGDQEDSNVTSQGQFAIPLKTYLKAELSGPACPVLVSGNTISRLQLKLPGPL